MWLRAASAPSGERPAFITSTGFPRGPRLVGRIEELVGIAQPLDIHQDLLSAVVMGQEPDVVAHLQVDAVSHTANPTVSPWPFC